jgi:hypothetical protein
MNVIHAAQAGQGGPVTIACINKATVDLGVPPRPGFLRPGSAGSSTWHGLRGARRRAPNDRPMPTEPWQHHPRK